ncbi:hypothetical protein A2810_00115 [candidate division Kazan bacterium RIFCSPHIGHO2_01_FULL_49_10]|uniref:Uncharacterized protein n=1 Tax=candidate division Kazan bacterium RIFCSPLOWO2_01_FULL_48_13 TaxID=1798539 RepID=A0A1F4PPY8_UNCK3|nr:MAG: hypothetical protein A2810_00115 [candidate division Kazan bacterium RIFCSPHIGHO2_01_FULL_49_10]OGB85689.1 MAG: hypothetical protein A2994_02960 [candidate division Kazan bacterium RIFCSPLOWO2_01_FULL_48_13]
MNERMENELKSAAAISAEIDAIRMDLKSYDIRGVPEMKGPTLVRLADAYERQAAVSQNPDGDLISEIICRVEAAKYLSGDDSTAYGAWEQRYQALSDLLDEDGQVRFGLSDDPRISQLDLDDIKRLMRDFEFQSPSARTNFGVPRYKPGEILAVGQGNHQLGIGRINGPDQPPVVGV